MSAVPRVNILTFPNGIQEAVRLLNPQVKGDSELISNIAWMTLEKFVNDVSEFTKGVRTSSIINGVCIVVALCGTVKLVKDLKSTIKHDCWDQDKDLKRARVVAGVTIAALGVALVNTVITYFYAKRYLPIS